MDLMIIQDFVDIGYFVFFMLLMLVCAMVSFASEIHALDVVVGGPEHLAIFYPRALNSELQPL